MSSPGESWVMWTGDRLYEVSALIIKKKHDTDLISAIKVNHLNDSNMLSQDSQQE